MPSESWGRERIAGGALISPQVRTISQFDNVVSLKRNPPPRDDNPHPHNGKVVSRNRKPIPANSNQIPHSDNSIPANDNRIPDNGNGIPCYAGLFVPRRGYCSGIKSLISPGKLLISAQFLNFPCSQTCTSRTAYTTKFFSVKTSDNRLL